MQKKGYHLAYEASLVVSEGYVGLLNRDEYNHSICHVFELIYASYTLFKTGSYAPSVFLCITVFEEIAKITAGHMRHRVDEAKQVKRHKDPLFQHGKKHTITLDPLYLTSRRISNSIGKERADEFFDKYENGEYSSLREGSLYFSRDKHGLHIPSQKINVVLSAEHLLVAIEIFSNLFWGMTAEASIICDNTNEMYDDVESIFKSS
jgi:AbiV family abortive infection protein